MDVSILVLSTSLTAESNSRRLARCMEEELVAAGATIDRLDLRDYDLPMCGVDGCWENTQTKLLRQRVEACDAVFVASPVYNYDVNAAAKNFIELTGSAWTEKIVAMGVTAGGQRSGMAPLGFINSLMLDFRCLVLPRYVYATDEAYTATGQPTEAISERIGALGRELLRLAKAMKT